MLFLCKINEKTMPLLTLLRPDNACKVVLWEIQEDEPTLSTNLPLTPEEQTDFDGISHPIQRVEWLACRVALQQLIKQSGHQYEGLFKDEFGKPHLINLPGHVSISHTSGWAAAAWHDNRPVGIDIEPLRTQFSRVVPRVLSELEIEHAAGNLQRLAMYWCAKEALYKLYGKRHLTFREHLHVDPFEDAATELIGHVRLPDHYEQLQIYCFHTGPGLMAVAF